ncbi:hypothetical protein GURKE_02320 [Brevundimonas phage vB_BpoS-Gurke]|uniref:Uncharacterized protein n=1 Tax=Brevundimonas phage vB_BpoS-Gurke TaxID=2948599 RepID=A0A9E7SQJ6_9CAUD|nr:hypothetical protein GURKE_02320 [Brevundimonas phage vB_BpoS-Gurke]
MRSSKGVPSFSGEIVNIRAGKATIQVANSGRLTFTFERMVWKAKSRSWVVYPQNLPRIVEALDQCDAQLGRAHIGDTPRLGDRVQVESAHGWVVAIHTRSQPSDRDPGMVFSVLDRVEVSLRQGGHVLPRSDMEWSGMQFDSKNSIWRMNCQKI